MLLLICLHLLLIFLPPDNILKILKSFVLISFNMAVDLNLEVIKLVIINLKKDLEYNL